MKTLHTINGKTSYQHIETIERNLLVNISLIALQFIVALVLVDIVSTTLQHNTAYVGLWGFYILNLVVGVMLIKKQCKQYKTNMLECRNMYDV